MNDKKFDGIIFDCDGVLVDITESYDKTIDHTCRYLLKKFAGIDYTGVIDGMVIDGFKATGGFNDEVDLTYASILSIYVAEKLEKNPNEFIFTVISHADKRGVTSVLEYLKSLYDITEILSKMGSLEDRHDNPVYNTFDQIFYGDKLYQKLFDKSSEFSGTGMINNDRIILSKRLLSILQKEFGKKLAIVSGRGIESIRHTLGDMLDYFDIDSSAFLEDEPRRLAKPNPESLIRAVTSMGCKNSLYVGDSMEDHLMAKQATIQGNSVTFCAVVGTSTSPDSRRQMFTESGADIILESIDDIPKVLNLD